jgi:cytochrome c oxidase subunit III
MATVATTHDTTKKGIDWNGGNEPFKASWGKLMMWFFLLSDAFSFSSLLIAYGLIRYSHEGFREGATSFSIDYWPTPEKVFEAVPFLHGVPLPLVFVGIMTFILIMSSVTMVLAVEAGHRRDRKDVEKWMLWTVLGGLTFLGSQAWEWTHFIHGTVAAGNATDTFGNVIYGANLIQNEYGPAPFANLFFFITGFHGFHVFSGVVLNVIIFYNVAFGLYDRKDRETDPGAEPYEMVEKVGLYWHFVDLVWVFVFTAFYLI